MLKWLKISFKDSFALILKANEEPSIYQLEFIRNSKRYEEEQFKIYEVVLIFKF